MTPRLHFFIGTVAELIKVAPVIAAVRAQGMPVHVIASGQNDLNETGLWQLAAWHGVDLQLSDGPSKKSAAGLLRWFCHTGWRGLKPMRQHVQRGDIVVVHGDTVSTLLGALLARAVGARVAHVEAGLRSFNLLEPFPEEICRVVVSRLAHSAFSPGAWASSNLRRYRRLEVVNTEHNTLLDSLRAAAETQNNAGIPKDYFLFVLHRQEHLLRPQLVQRLVEQCVLGQSQRHAVVVLHANTSIVLQELGLLEALEAAPHVTLLSRQPYMHFMTWLRGCSFIITDGGSNQEEAFYLGKPCLLLRHHTERREGLGENVVLSSCDAETIENFLNNPQRYAREPIAATIQPAVQIAEHLTRATQKGAA